MTQIPNEHYERAAANGVSPQTLYNRVCRGWDIELAINTPPDHKKQSLRERSRFYGMVRGKSRSIKVPIQYEDQLNQEVAKSGLTELDFLTEIVVNWLEAQAKK